MKDQKLSKKFTIYAVVGPTASGKTERALELVEELLRDRRWKIEDGRDVVGVNLISVDSRQVYQGLEITTGADVPVEFKFFRNTNFPYSFFKHKTKSINLHGVSIIDVTDEWSVSHFLAMATQIIGWSVKHNWAVILVGGTGLYHRQLQWLLEGKELVDVPPNKEIREKAEKMSVRQLQDWLRRLDESRLADMNRSDRNNPRRLVRAIEIAEQSSELKIKSDPPASAGAKQLRAGKLKVSLLLRRRSHPVPIKSGSGSQADKVNQVSNQRFRNKFGMTTKGTVIDYQVMPFFPRDFKLLAEKIRKRVVKRLKQGALNEVKNLLKLNLDPKGQVMTTLGVPEMRQFLEGKIHKDELIDLWSLHEIQYAKRQLTWWRKH